MSKLSYISLLLLPLIAPGCSSDTDQQQASAVPVSFAMGFGGGAMTRESTLDNYWTEGEGQYIAVKNSNSSVGVLKYEPDETSASSSAPVPLKLVNSSDIYYWPLNNPGWTFTAWYPYSESAPSSVEVAEDQTVWDETTNPDGITDATYYSYDLLYAPEVSNVYLATVPLTFYHLMSRVVVTVNSSNTENRDHVVSVTFGSGNIHRKCNITTLGTTGTGGTTVWGTPNDDSPKSIKMRMTNANAERLVYTFECMLPPQNGGNSSTALLTIKTDAADANESTYIYKAAFDLKAGYQNNYDITASAQGLITITSASVTNWNSTQNKGGTDATVPDVSY